MCDIIIAVDDPIWIIVNNVYFIPTLLDPIAIFFFIVFGVAFAVSPIVIIRCLFVLPDMSQYCNGPVSWEGL